MNKEGLQNTIFVTGGSTRHEEEDRIQFLARVRNEALEPLWWPQNISRHDVMQPADSQTIYSSFPDHITNTTLSSSSTHGSTHGSSSSSAHSKHWFFAADKVVFLNDVYFCAQHVHRLLAHEGVNLACGLDHYQARVAQKFPESWRMNIRGFQVCHAMPMPMIPFVSLIMTSTCICPRHPVSVA